MKELTEKQLELLSFIKHSYDENGIMPTLSEISAAFSYSDKAAWDAVEALVRKGYVEKERGSHRSIRLSSAEREQRENIRIPLYDGMITAESIKGPSDAFVYISRKLAEEKSLFAIRVSSLSMKNAGILPGDVAVLSRITGQVEDSSIVLAAPKIAEDSAEIDLRRYRRTPFFSELWPENDSMGIIKAPEFTFYGKLIMIIRSYR